jgi:hypothetical protein
MASSDREEHIGAGGDAGDRGAAARGGLLTQRLLALFTAGALLLNFPLLVLAIGAGGPGGAASPALLGLPRLPVLLFGAFALLIALLAVLMERGAAAE